MHAFFTILEKAVEIPSGNPCVPSPCGANSQCRVIGTQAACSCLPNYVGRPPSCRPECVINEECPGNLACQNERCKDPCPGSCGSFATCIVIKHVPVCQCLGGYTGDPFTGCAPAPTCKNHYLSLVSSNILLSTYRVFISEVGIRKNLNYKFAIAAYNQQ